MKGAKSIEKKDREIQVLSIKSGLCQKDQDSASEKVTYIENDTEKEVTRHGRKEGQFKERSKIHLKETKSNNSKRKKSIHLIE